MDEAGPSGISRRSLMLGSSALLAMVASPALIGRAEAQPVAALRSGELLTPPSFAGRIGNFAGVRPYRTGGVRIEAVPIGGNRFIIHNYGHGGAGITLSWGTARAVVGILRSLEGRVGRLDTLSVGIVGSGVAGLTVATLLRQRFPRMPITIYSKDRVEATTSFVAGGQFAPAGMAGVYRGRTAELHALVQGSFDELTQLRRGGRGADYGIFERFNYTLTRNDSFESAVPRSVVPAPSIGRMPFATMRSVVGFEYKTMLVDPTILLPRLLRDLRGRQRFTVVNRMFGSAAEIQRLPQSVIINCSGFGAKALFGDANLVPIRGQIVRFQNSQRLRYFFSEGCDLPGTTATYLFCRRNDIIVGGTYEPSISSSRPVSADCDRIVNRMRALVGNGNLAVCQVPAS